MIFVCTTENKIFERDRKKNELNKIKHQQRKNDNVNNTQKDTRTKPNEEEQNKQKKNRLRLVLWWRTIEFSLLKINEQKNFHSLRYHFYLSNTDLQKERKSGIKKSK